MTPFLLFTLHAPMMSFGEIAVGEVRGSWGRPSKSAVLGLVGAALGLERSDPVWDRMDAAYGFAVRTEHGGRVVTDYHTVQSAPTPRKRTFATRRDLLTAPNVATLVTRRDYLCDALFTVLLVAGENPPATLDDVAKALERPRFTLYLGRKSCPLALPPNPIIVEAATIAGAFAAHAARWPKLDDRVQRRVRGKASPGRAIALDSSLAGTFSQGLDAYAHYVRRRDRIASRARWQFGLRDETETRLKEPAS